MTEPFDDADIAAALRRAATPLEYDEQQLPLARAAGARLRRRRQLLARGTGAALVMSAAAVTALLVDPFGSRSAGLAVSAVVECSSAGTRLDVSRVEVSRSGLPLEVRNSTATAVFLTAGAYSVAVPPGRTRTDLPLPPGDVQVSCDDSAPATLRLLDPTGVYAAGQSHCGPAAPDTPADEVAVGDPSRLTLSALDGRLGGRLGGHLGSGARTRPLGYPQASIRTVGVVEDGRLVAVATWRELAVPGAWALGGVSVCSGGPQSPIPSHLGA